VQVETQHTFDSGVVWAPFGRVSWVHEFEPQRDITAALSLLPVGAFTVEGPRAASDSARLEAGSNLYLTRSAALFGSFIGEFSNRGSIYSGNGSMARPAAPA
jgi:outer membrane autotransporter protein